PRRSWPDAPAPDATCGPPLTSQSVGTTVPARPCREAGMRISAGRCGSVPGAGRCGSAPGAGRGGSVPGAGQCGPHEAGRWVGTGKAVDHDGRHCLVTVVLTAHEGRGAGILPDVDPGGGPAHGAQPPS